MPDHVGSEGCEAVVWDLEPIVGGRGAEGARQLLEEARLRAAGLAREVAGRVAGFDADALVRTARELAEIRELLLRGDGYARLRGYADSSDAAALALQGAAEAVQAEVDADLLVFELEWNRLDDVTAQALLRDAGDRLDFAAHHLRRLRDRRPHLLSPEEERILAETSVQRLSAWKRLYSENAAMLMIELDGETLPLAQVLSRLTSPDRQQRHAASAAIARGATEGLPTRVAAYNQVLGEKAVDDRLRGYPTWLSSRNLTNETSDSAVAALLDAVDARHDLPRRWHRLKARMLDVERLTSADLQAPLPSDDRPVSFAESRETIISAWSGFSPRAGAIIELFFARGLIDAPIRANKQSGALCALAGTSSPPYVLVNYSSRPLDTMMLAHELGHALHFELSRDQGALQCETSIPMDEVASTFSEALVTDHLRSRAPGDRDRLTLLASRLDDAMSNVFMSCALLGAEAEMHRRRREQGELSADELSDITTGSLGRLWGDTVEIDGGTRLMWSLIPHMIWDPGYLYSYAYGLLTAWTAHARSGQPGFAEAYLAMLTAGGSRRPEDLIAMLGLDSTDPGFWAAGLDRIDDMLSEVETLAESVRF